MMVLFNFHSQRIGSCWLLQTITFLIALLQWNSMRPGYAVLVTALAAEDSPGYVYPTSQSILIGSNATINCSLSEPNSSQIWFDQLYSNQSIKQPSDKIKIIDEYTAQLIIQNAAEQKSWFHCMVGNSGIGMFSLFVGKQPQNVTDFTCVVYDYKYMQCSFTKPKNNLKTDFDLEYRMDEDNSIHKCVCDEQADRQQCNATKYLPVREKYVFTLMGRNDCGRNLQKFIIYNDKVVIPSALEVNAQNITSDSVTLTWDNFMIVYYEMGLRYEIKIYANHSDWIREEKGVIPPSMGTYKVTLNNLYSYWPYTAKVRVRSNAANETVWSETSTTWFQTEGKRPRKAPDVPRGSFFIDSTETRLRLYWAELPKHERNGPGFHYIVSEIDSNGVVMDNQVKAVNGTSITLPWRNESMQIFSIKSKNVHGDSGEANTILVYRSGSPRYELNENNIAKVYHNSSYTLSWSPPENVDDLLNYTVFWCLPKIEVHNECKGPISYNYLDKLSTNFTTKPKDRSLNLAISANYPHYSKGMQWARCSSQVSSEMLMAEIEVNVLNASSVLVKWYSGNVCPSILEGYNLTFCQASEDNQCVKKEESVQLSREFRNYTIHNLPSFTRVCTTMYMFATSKNRGRDSKRTCVRTKASAPSKPKNLKVIPNTVTSKSASFKWSPPDNTNGILSDYTIYWRKNNGTWEKATTSNQTSFNLTGLNSSSDYEVYVTAHTIEESRHSDHVNISTLIGIPSSPRNVIIEDTVIYWDQPDLPSGRHVYYIVALMYRNDANESIYERVSIVRGHSCRFRNPDCSPPTRSRYYLHVRAVNVGARAEIDTEITSMSRDVILDSAEIDQSFCTPDNGELEENIFVDDNTKFYFASTWIDTHYSHSCGDSMMSLYAVAFVVVIAFVVYICYWIRNKYYKMKNIKVILPEGLVDQVSSNYKFAGNALSSGCDLEASSKKDFHSDISRSNDCLVAFGHKENHNLISNFHNRSANAFSSLSSNNSSKNHQNDDHIGEHPSLETTNEDLSSNSSASSNSNLTYHNHHQIKRLSSIDGKNRLAIASSERQEEDEDNPDSAKEYNEHDNAPNVSITQNIGDGYVAHNTQLLASIINASERTVPPPNQFPPSFPAMTNDGYIQPSATKQLFQPNHPPPSTSLDGYTCIEALGKMSTIPDATIQQHLTSPILTSPMASHPRSFPSNNAPTTHTSPVITDLEETDHHSKDVLSPNAAAGAGTILLPNNNNNTIYGYVTQQQLANYGTNVALAKELNT